MTTKAKEAVQTTKAIAEKNGQVIADDVRMVEPKERIFELNAQIGVETRIISKLQQEIQIRTQRANQCVAEVEGLEAELQKENQED